MSKTYVTVLVLALGLVGCSKSEAASPNEAVAAILVSGMEPGLSGIYSDQEFSTGWKTSLVSNDPYTIQYTADARKGRITLSYAIKASDGCKYKVSTSRSYNGNISDDEIDVDFSSLTDVKPAGGSVPLFNVSFADSCAVNHKNQGCDPFGLRVSKVALSLEKMQKAAADMKAICKPS